MTSSHEAELLPRSDHLHEKSYRFPWDRDLLYKPRLQSASFRAGVYKIMTRCAPQRSLLGSLYATL
jgi:hypothetical protein